MGGVEPVFVGKRFGRLLVVASAENRLISGKKRQYWPCRCDCGVEKKIIGRSLQVGDAVSCGCLKAERAAKLNRSRHGYATRRSGVTPEYRAWAHAKERCLNPNVRNYGSYGGRGITMCDEWQKSFDSFIDHIGPRPSSAHSLDRIDNDGNYEPGNVRWATRSQQRRNRRDARTGS